MKLISKMTLITLSIVGSTSAFAGGVDGGGIPGPTAHMIQLFQDNAETKNFENILIQSGFVRSPIIDSATTISNCRSMGTWEACDNNAHIVERFTNAEGKELDIFGEVVLKVTGESEVTVSMTPAPNPSDNSSGTKPSKKHRRHFLAN